MGGWGKGWGKGWGPWQPMFMKSWGKGKGKGWKKTDPALKVWIGNLPSGLDWKTLETHMQQAGKTKWVEAFKGKEGACWERNQAVIYRGPFKEVLDDDGHRMERGRRYAVCDKTYQIYRREPYAGSFDFVDPLEEVPLEEAAPFDCSRTALRHPKETKGQDYTVTTEAVADCCGPDGGC